MARHGSYTFSDVQREDEISKKDPIGNDSFRAHLSTNLLVILSDGLGRSFPSIKYLLCKLTGSPEFV